MKPDFAIQSRLLFLQERGQSGVVENPAAKKPRLVLYPNFKKLLD